MEILQNSLDKVILDATKEINCQLDTKAYIQSIFKEYIVTNNDLSRNSITMIYLEAKLEYNFSAFKNIGDWLLYTKTLFPQAQMSQNSYYDIIAKDSYLMCYKILNQKWPLFFELSQQYIELSKQLQIKIKSLSSI